MAAPIVKASALDVVVPVATVTFTEPAVVISVLETDACNCVVLTKPVTNWVPFHCTAEACVKPLPLTIKMKLGPPGAAEDGESEVRLGPVGAAIVKVNVPDVPPFGVFTVTLEVPALAIKPAAMFAFN